MLRAALRAPLLMLLILGYAVIAGASVLLPGRARRLIWRAAWTHRFSRLGLILLGVRVRLERPSRRMPEEGGVLQVANHLSYLDILVLASLRPSLFVTSREVGADPFLGTLAKLGGSVFVDRRNPAGLRIEINALAGLLREGFRVSLFPEGTSSDGSAVLPFKTALMHSALETGSAVQGYCIRYLRVDGRAFNPGPRDRVCWHGDMHFLPHLFRLLCISRILVRVIALPAILPYPGLTRYELGDALYLRISRMYNCLPAAAPKMAEERPARGRADAAFLGLSVGPGGAGG